MHKTVYNYAALFAALGVPYTHGHSVPRHSPNLELLLSRAGSITYAASCNGYPNIQKGVEEAITVSKAAASTLNAENPFESSANPFAASWEAIREAIFGDESITSEATLLSMLYCSPLNDGNTDLDRYVQQYRRHWFGRDDILRRAAGSD
jgi:hypothetical protein